jgi:hypothetical protein
MALSRQCGFPAAGRLLIAASASRQFSAAFPIAQFQLLFEQLHRVQLLILVLRLIRYSAGHLAVACRLSLFF